MIELEEEYDQCQYQEEDGVTFRSGTPGRGQGEADQGRKGPVERHPAMETSMFACMLRKRRLMRLWIQARYVVATSVSKDVAL